MAVMPTGSGIRGYPARWTWAWAHFFVRGHARPDARELSGYNRILKFARG